VLGVSILTLVLWFFDCNENKKTKNTILSEQFPKYNTVGTVPKYNTVGTVPKCNTVGTVPKIQCTLHVNIKNDLENNCIKKILLSSYVESTFPED
jgi:hypothetical protein